MASQLGQRLAFLADSNNATVAFPCDFGPLGVQSLGGQYRDSQGSMWTLVSISERGKTVYQRNGTTELSHSQVNTGQFVPVVEVRQAALHVPYH